MTYESPITLIQAQTNNFFKEINEKTDEVIFKAVINVLPQVNKDELIRALAYDRGQYVKGYQDRDSEIVRCKDCRYFKKIVERSDSGLCHRDLVATAWKENGYCSRGERKGGDDE